MSDDLVAALRDSIRVSPAIPDGEVWLTSGCALSRTWPGPHGDPAWRVMAMCVHEHLERNLVCGTCKENLERWQKTALKPPAPWCGKCYMMRPGGHHCTAAVEFTALGSGPPLTR